MATSPLAKTSANDQASTCDEPQWHQRLNFFNFGDVRRFNPRTSQAERIANTRLTTTTVVQDDRFPMLPQNDTHLKVVGYILWLFGFTGAHRFYYGKPITGTIWFFTAGLLGIGWLIDLFLIPGMDHDADRRFRSGPIDYSVAWVFLTFLGVFGLHRFYMGKIITGLLYLVTGGLFGLGLLYDFWTLNGQVSESNFESDMTRQFDHGKMTSAT